MLIRELTGDDAEACAALRREALLQEPLAFASHPESDRASSADQFRAQLQPPDNVVLGAFDSELVGMVGLFRPRQRKVAHRANLWGMYVQPDQRRRGLAAALLDAAIEHARGLPGVSWIQLGVTSDATAARELYQRAGFRIWGTEPDALRHDDQTVAEHHMALRLSSATDR